jgi:cytoskeletal protein CcmA (bactofilin family)
VWNKPQADQEPNQPEPQAPAPTSPKTSSRQAVLGPSISIKGNVSGEEDLLIEGRVDGEISFQKHSVTIGSNGRIKADVHCRNVFVEGAVEGNLYGQERVVVRSSGRVQGNAVAPRVVLEDGANFRGSIDMQPKAAKTEGATAKTASMSKGGSGGSVAAGNSTSR